MAKRLLRNWKFATKRVPFYTAAKAVLTVIRAATEAVSVRTSFSFVSDEIKGLIHARATVAELWQVAVAQGMTTLVQDGVQKVLAGWTDYGQVKAAATR